MSTLFYQGLFLLQPLRAPFWVFPDVAALRPSSFEDPSFSLAGTVPLPHVLLCRSILRGTYEWIPPPDPRRLPPPLLIHVFAAGACLARSDPPRSPSASCISFPRSVLMPPVFFPPTPGGPYRSPSSTFYPRFVSPFSFFSLI